MHICSLSLQGTDECDICSVLTVSVRVRTKFGSLLPFCQWLLPAKEKPCRPAISPHQRMCFSYPLMSAVACLLAIIVTDHPSLTTRSGMPFASPYPHVSIVNYPHASDPRPGRITRWDTPRVQTGSPATRWPVRLRLSRSEVNRRHI